ncbi:ThiF family adenylyltransferase [Pseudodesulfovibrio sp. zrk46]|uniref:HesA/MoeB/ThiF family protein n=1 Tax=Pseudodesulfovibrio sp. zrk46 TaxID=2725288 RepID=UPI0014497475|nr:ThiF family adenylyltransferase [Pseudodesulfovibrio sp. zrk46]QJB57983.1 HesA/MoeB/ThiF family protein [Pseudodesulfovibrio sp. zrk46]
MASLGDLLRQQAVNIDLPKGGTGDIVSVCAVDEIAQQLNMPGHTVEAEALKRDIIPTRYLRNMDSITATDQIQLLESRIAQVGLGGLGGNLLEMFLRTGVGYIRGADGDTFEESNLNRQLLSMPDAIGIPKAEAAAKRAASLNSSTTFEGHNSFLTKDNLPDFLEGADVAIDALGGLEMRLALQQAAAQKNIPLVTGALAGWTGYVGVVLPGQVGPANIMGDDNGAEEKLGCPAPSVTFMASLMAAETVRLLTGSKSPLAGTIMVIDLKSLTFEKITL